MYDYASVCAVAQVPSVDSVVGGDHHLVTEIEDLVREKMVRLVFLSHRSPANFFFCLFLSLARNVLC